MPTNTLRGSDFKETYAVHAALRHGLKSRIFGKDATAKRSAERLLKYLESDKSIYGRQCKMIRLLKKSADVGQLRRGLRCSRRTVFRYLLDLEKAGIEIRLEEGHYTAAGSLLSLVS